MTRTRRNVWDLAADATDTTLLWYGRAVEAMQKLPITDYRSWRYQAAIHDYTPGRDPFAQPGEQLPPVAEQKRFWRQCQHATWFFLPWHRMYLHHFENIVAAQIVALGGPAGWSLPYWNYSKDAGARRLPPQFRARTLNNEPNPLYVEARVSAANLGQDFADENDVQLADSLGAAAFANSQFSGSPGFGGPVSGFNHQSGPIGILELVPHGLMHSAVGGDEGWMNAFDTAALDPIFWLHHSNIDRLWQVWLQRDAAHKNPTEAFWQNGVKFEFRQADGAPVQMTAAQVLDSLAAGLDYQYDDVSDPLGVLEAATPGTLEGAMAKDSMPELVGATSAPLALGELTQHAVIPTALPAASMLESVQDDKRIYLHVEHLTSDNRAPSYDVYLGVPSGADPTAYKDKHAGRISTFGITDASRKDGPNSGSGLTVALEVTDVVRRLRENANWNPAELGVAFVPVRGGKGASVRVGRVSLYVK